MLLVASDAFDRFRTVPSRLPANVVVRYIAEDKSILPTRLVERGGAPERLIVADRSLLVDAPSVGELSRLDRHFDLEDVQLVGMFDQEADYGTVEGLNAVADRWEIPHRVEPAPDLDAVLQHARNPNGKTRLLIVVGHNDGSRWVTLNEHGQEVFSVATEELAARARANGVTVLALGCETGPGGYVGRVETDAVVKHLGQALKARSYRDFYGRLGTPEVPLQMTSELISGVHVTTIRRMDMLAEGESKVIGSQERATAARKTGKPAAGEAGVGGSREGGITTVVLMRPQGLELPAGMPPTSDQELSWIVKDLYVAAIVVAILVLVLVVDWLQSLRAEDVLDFVLGLPGALVAAGVRLAYLRRCLRRRVARLRDRD